ncbi:DUF2644 domain-containing protein [Lonepinella koalarum]|uniref:DUF2644 domain-containing protein n=1 Tax=Lonepinella koalarum TaxID=53417 RepID=UPI003F6E070B
MSVKELISNHDGRLSTTATIQFFGFVAAVGVMLYSVYMDKSYVPELFSTFLFACVGTAATKGVANALQRTEDRGRKGVNHEFDFNWCCVGGDWRGCGLV